MLRRHRHRHGRRAVVARCFFGAIVGGATLVAAAPAGAATGITAKFNLGVLTVVGDANNNSIVVSRNAAGNILVNNGAITVSGGNPSVANTTTITVVGAAGNDTLMLDESSGALPRA